ncbi:transcriptional regulator [Micromonospora sp. STR1s_5]|nr:transcriptional regulator [Micromonospora sp. STR1s_5]
MTSLITLAAVFVALYALHPAADHWIQTQAQADHKGCDPDHGTGRHEHCTTWQSRWHCAKHVATYGLTQLAGITVLIAVFGLRLSPLSLALGMAINLGTHYLADRRVPFRAIAERLGSGGFYQLGLPRAGRDDNPSLGTGAYALDQSWHIAFLFISAVVIAL